MPSFKEYIKENPIDKDIKKFYIPYISLTDLYGIENYKHIEILDISKNLIKDLEPLKYLNNLNGLMAMDNKINNIEPLKYCKNLISLDLDNNPINNIEAIYHLDNLKFLSIRKIKTSENYEPYINDNWRGWVTIFDIDNLKNIIKFERRKRLIGLLN